MPQAALTQNPAAVVPGLETNAEREFDGTSRDEGATIFLVKEGSLAGFVFCLTQLVILRV